jgi:hypothetical protein
VARHSNIKSESTYSLSKALQNIIDCFEVSIDRQPYMRGLRKYSRCKNYDTVKAFIAVPSTGSMVFKSKDWKVLREWSFHTSVVYEISWKSMIYKRTKQLSGGSRKVTSDVTSKNPSN